MMLLEDGVFKAPAARNCGTIRAMETQSAVEKFGAGRFGALRADMLLTPIQRPANQLLVRNVMPGE
ncbi:MAG: hypothetical protein R2844_13025 [Caldilineales bacterium]